ncbi:MAG: hypothetical protein GX844_04720 [Alcaligenaceae bacterium]|jgi:hypothetical protein|nr:hypothetical protein [Alcaligenaceae bacterium]
MKKQFILALIGLSCLLVACAHPNPRGAVDDMVGTVGGSLRNISTTK